MTQAPSLLPAHTIEAAWGPLASASYRFRYRWALMTVVPGRASTVWSSAPEVWAVSSPADLPCLPQTCLPVARGLPVLLDPFGFSLELSVLCLVFPAALSAVDTLDQDTSGWSRCLYVLASSGTERPDVASLQIAQHHLAQRPAHACSDLGGAGGHTALALRLSWLPGLGVVTRMPGWPVQRGERKEPKKANAPSPLWPHTRQEGSGT